MTDKQPPTEVVVIGLEDGRNVRLLPENWEWTILPYPLGGRWTQRVDAGTKVPCEACAIRGENVDAVYWVADSVVMQFHGDDEIKHSHIFWEYCGECDIPAH